MNKYLRKNFMGEVEAEVPVMMSKADNNVFDFKNKYGALAKKYIETAQAKRNIADSIRSAISDREDILEALGSECIEKYPDLKQADILKLVPTLSPDHPIWKIFIKFKGPLTALDQKIAFFFKKYRDIFEEIQCVQDEMTEAEIVYEEEQNKISPEFTPVSELIKDLEPVSDVEFSDDALIMESVSALDLVDEESRLSIERELSSMIDGEKVKSLDEQLASEKKPINKKLVYGGLAALAYFLFT